MGTFFTSKRMDPTKQLKKEIDSSLHYTMEFWALHTALQTMFDGGMPYPAALDKAKQQVGWK